MFNTHTNSFRQSLRPIENDAMRRIAPSIFAEHAHESRSDRYTYIPTITVVDALRCEGFLPVEVRQGRSRIPGKQEFTKHLVKFMHQDGMQQLQGVGDSIPQVCLVNSHDGTSAYKLYAGMIRLACLNGLIVCDGDFDAITVQHKGNIANNVIEGSYEVIDHAKSAVERSQDWRSISLAPPEQEVFARNAIALRFDDPETPAPISPVQVLNPRRCDDVGSDLWSTFNRVQEHLVKGGNRYRNESGRRMSTRPVRGIDADMTLNRALWRLADEMRALKIAA